MRILLCTHSLRRGGAERVLLELAIGLCRKGHEVHIVSWLNVDEYSETAGSGVTREYLIAKENYNWPYSVMTSSHLLRGSIKRFQPDVIEVHAPNMLWVVALARPSAPVVHVLHGYGWITTDRSFKNVVVRALDHFCCRALGPRQIVVAAPMIDVAAAHYRVSPKIFSCVTNGVDVEVFTGKHRSSSDPPGILMVGTINANKGQDLAITAWYRLKNRIPNATLTIVGDGPDRAALEQKVQHMGSDARIRLLGQRADVATLMSQATVLWQLSQSEGFPLVVLEAMASGLPVVGFDVRGIRDTVINGRTGYLVDYGDIDGIAERTAAILNDASLRSEMSSYGRQHAETTCSLQSMIEGHEKVLGAAVRD